MAAFIFVMSTTRYMYENIELQRNSLLCLSLKISTGNPMYSLRALPRNDSAYYSCVFQAAVFIPSLLVTSCCLTHGPYINV